MADTFHFVPRAGMPPAKPVPPLSQPLVFGKFFTEHMARATYTLQKDWHDCEVAPYEPIQLAPAAAALHYGQTVFEGIKAFRLRDRGIGLFRLERHAQRFRQSCERTCMPVVPAKMFVEAVSTLVRTDGAWIPEAPDASLYVRPAMIATEAFLGVRPAREYLFFVIASPVGAYYASGFDPVSIWIERDLSRAAIGGLGAAKTGANYVASLLASEKAHERGYVQVLWTDAKTHDFIEEVGTMNVFVRFRDHVATPPLRGTLLDGVTRDCVRRLLADWAIPAVERPISVDELRKAHEKGDLLEVFGTGTGAVISPVGRLGWESGTMEIGEGKTGDLARRLFAEITGIQRGEIADRHGWVTEL